MQAKFKSLEETKTGDLENWIPGTWFDKVKTKSDGSLQSYKTCFVAKSFKHGKAIGYGESFAPTNKPKTHTVLLSMAAMDELILHRWKLSSTRR